MAPLKKKERKKCLKNRIARRPVFRFKNKCLYPRTEFVIKKIEYF